MVMFETYIRFESPVMLTDIFPQYYATKSRIGHITI
jgi:hypothetical protein